LVLPPLFPHIILHLCFFSYIGQTLSCCVKGFSVVGCTLGEGVCYVWKSYRRPLWSPLAHWRRPPPVRCRITTLAGGGGGGGGRGGGGGGHGQGGGAAARRRRWLRRQRRWRRRRRTLLHALIVKDPFLVITHRSISVSNVRVYCWRARSGVGVGRDGVGRDGVAGSVLCGGGKNEEKGRTQSFCWGTNRPLSRCCTACARSPPPPPLLPL